MIKIEIPDLLYKNIIEFCKLNNISESEKYIIKLIQLGFNIEKYGISPLKREQQVVIEQEKQQATILPQVEEEQNENKSTKSGKRVRIIKTDSTK